MPLSGAKTRGIASVRVSDLLVIVRTEHVWVAAGKGIRGQIRGDAIRPGGVCGLVVVGLPGGHDFDHAMGARTPKAV